jgi:TatD DNase family protein
MIYDTHAHYDDEAFQEDRDDLLKSLPHSGIGRVVNIGASLTSCVETMELAAQYPFMYAALGVHPSECGELTDRSMEWLKDQLSFEKCVAVGEIGLDYHYPDPSSALQKKWFSCQLNLARQSGLPVVIHSREAAKDTIDIMQEEKAGDIGGVMHCFSYGKEIAKQVLQMGFYIGIGGVLTFTNGRKLKEAAEYIPIDSIVLETDCPYLAPVPNRGKRNSSLYLPYVVEALAQIKHLTPDQVEEFTWQNACRLYRQQQTS